MRKPIVIASVLVVLAAGQETRGERVLLTLPFMAWLHGLAGRTLA